MLSLLTGLGAPIPLEQKTLNLIETPPAVVQQVKPELTIDQKITSNFYKCNTEVQWIRADNAQCLDKAPTPQPAASNLAKPSNQVSVNGNGYNAYEPGQCVWYVKNLRSDIPNNWGNASQWLYNAQAQGWPTGTVPKVGAVGWTSGHVVLITAVNSDGTVSYTDMNGRWIAYEVGHGTKPASYYQYIY